MMLYMDSKVFKNEFLVNEKDNDILKYQYVIISNRIHKRGSSMRNIISYTSLLYPSGSVMGHVDVRDMEDAYYEQLDECITSIAILVNGCIEEDMDIIFICTHQEMKWELKYLQLLAEYIYERLGYPVYDYTLYANNAHRKLKYDKNSVKKKCKKIIEKDKKRMIKKNMESEQGQAANLKMFSKLDKKAMKKELKSRGLYVKGMSKSEMIDTYDVYQ